MPSVARAEQMRLEAEDVFRHFSIVLLPIGATHREHGPHRSLNACSPLVAPIPDVAQFRRKWG